MSGAICDNDLEAIASLYDDIYGEANAVHQILLNAEVDVSRGTGFGEKYALTQVGLSYGVVLANKFAEAHQHYSKHFTGCQLHNFSKSLKKDVERRRITEFRNRCIGHAMDRQTGRPLNTEEIHALSSNVLGGGVEEFAHWLWTPTNPPMADRNIGGCAFYISKLLQAKIAAMRGESADNRQWAFFMRSDSFNKSSNK